MISHHPGKVAGVAALVRVALALFLSLAASLQAAGSSRAVEAGLFEGWNSVAYDGPAVCKDALTVSLDASISPASAWTTVAWYDGAAWLQHFKAAPLPSFNTLPAMTSGETYWVFATAEAALDSAPLGSVVAGCEAQPSSAELIDAALEAGEIDEETALVYQVFAVYGDERLPAKFSGDDSEALSSLAPAAAIADLGSLSAEAQETLAPFLLPPSAPGSWLEQQAAAAGRTNHWNPVPSANGRVQVWWQTAVPGDQFKAASLAGEIDSDIWPKLTSLMGVEPLPDGDGILDIYLVRMSGGATTPYGGCEGTRPDQYWEPKAVFVNVDSRSLPSKLRSVTAHEFMHVLQMTFELKHCYHPEYFWWMDATANWAMDYVYPNDNVEHGYAKYFLNVPEVSLEGGANLHRYGAYLFPFFLTKEGKASFINSWEAFATMDSLDGVNSVLPGGFEGVWADFLVANWNQDDWDDYLDLDGLSDTPKHTDVDVLLEGVTDATFSIDVSVPHLAANYVHLRFDDPEVRTAVFYNGYNHQLDLLDLETGGIYQALPLLPEQSRGAIVEALVQYEGGGWVREDWSDKPLVSFCRDDPEQRVQQVILVFGNFVHDDRQHVLEPASIEPRVWASNLGCRDWEGELTWVSQVEGKRTEAEAFVSFRMVPTETIPGAGPYLLAFGDYKITAGSIDYEVSGSIEDCAYSGSGTLPADANSYMNVGQFFSHGPWHRSYSISVSAVGVAVEHAVCEDSSVDTEFGISLAGGTGTWGGPKTYFYIDDSGASLSGRWDYDYGTSFTWDLHAVGD
jgi:hypothetical protein